MREPTSPTVGPLAAARLLGLRLQGFKSFAERTTVEFGGGISAVVGPNGSGKSNLADALRWALGEQGRALRSRKAEDVIWAGSEKRAAQGMADVTLVLDNADGLLPVDFQVLELGRRLFRSGENEYLLNKQRIRLRDLVDLLDGAHLADNAFLFIGQGMVDQALALRPEERRPLFEEVAGVRRHERRRRKAEEQLVESSANLARVEDILAELRPQARRAAAQAEQQADRTSVGDELAAALLLSTHARWHGAAARLEEVQERAHRARLETDRAMAELQAAESSASSIAAGLALRATAERQRREAHDTARAALTGLQLRDGRIASELDGADRDGRRLAAERGAAEADIAAGRRALAVPVPARDLELEAALSEAERQLADALAELATLRTASQARGEELAAIRRAQATRQAEADTARRRLADAQRRLTDESAATSRLTTRRTELAQAHATATTALSAAIAAETQALGRRESTRLTVETAEAERSGLADRMAAASAAAAGLRGRMDGLMARLAEEERRPIARAARGLGGRRVDEDLVVEPGLRAAIEAALATLVRAYVLASDGVAALAAERGSLVVQERIESVPDTRDAAVRRLLEATEAAGGGSLGDAVQRDGTGAARRLLQRAIWLPDLPACLAIQAVLPAGWLAVVRDGSAVVDGASVSLGAPESVLERRAEHDRVAGDVERAERALAAVQSELAAATERATATRSGSDAAGTEASRAGHDRRTAEERERISARAVEAAARELAWHEAQLERVQLEVERLGAAPSTDADDDHGPIAADGTGDARAEPASAVALWESRATALRERRDRLAGQLGELETVRRAAEHERARAEGAVALAEERLVRAGREASASGDRVGAAEVERAGVRAELARAVAAEGHARDALDALLAADAVDRDRLSDAERDAAAARGRLRAADERSRAAERVGLEARLILESLRESILVELAGLGSLGLDGLVGVAGPGRANGPSPAETTLQDSEDGRADPETAAFEAAMEAAAAHWAAVPPSAIPPTTARLAQMRRRYHELGAANPYAVEEYAALKVRLETLETQNSDLRSAISRTRELIAELDRLIADQFRTTFEALESAFERRFEQLFGGGFARLSLTDPNDLGSTGIDIVARPPGKKAQALAMLSGGERALTAVALLFSMLEVRPVPFCVLDEVDAALDEANIGRFVDALRSLAHQTQFIVITHNRGTIEAADALYGVTVGDDSVSRVISLRLDEATALAAQQQPDAVLVG